MQVKRQQNIQASFMSDTQQRFTLVLQQVSTDLIANDPALQTISIDGNQTVRYDGASAVFIANDAMMQTKYRGINNFTFLNASGVVLQFGSGDSFPATNQWRIQGWCLGCLGTTLGSKDGPSFKYTLAWQLA